MENEKVEKIKFGEKFAYGLGDFSNNSAYVFVGTFVISFLTIALGQSGVMAGTIIMVVTIFDAVNDVLIGSLIDRLHGRGVKYTRVLRMSIVPVGVLMVLLFWSPNFSVVAKIVYALLIYAAYTVAQTTYQVPFGSLSSAMTGDTNQRIQLGAFRDWGANLGSFIVNTFASVMILFFGGGEMNTRGFFFCALVIAVVLIIGGIIPGIVCKERVPVVESQDSSLKEGLKSFVKNRPAIIATVVVCLVNCLIMVRASFTTYYAMYYLGHPGWISPILSVMSIVPLIAIFFIPVMTKKLDRKIMYVLAGCCIAVSGVIQLLMGNLAGSIIASILCGFSLCFSITVTWGAMPDIADYGEYVSGTYSIGVCYSTLTFVMKLATAIASMVLGVILDTYGFEAGNVTDNAINGIRLWYGVLPIILGAATLIVALFFNLTHSQLVDVHKELDARHNAAESESAEA